MCWISSIYARKLVRVEHLALLRASLRWRPDRIILGEVRGEGARTLLDSFNTGHAGSMATIHASSPLQATGRFAELAKRSHQQSNLHDIAAEIGDRSEERRVGKECRSRGSPH